MPLAPGTRLGPYEIVSLLGQGGMGEVYRARDGRLSRDVAIKTSRQEFNDRFLREARAVAALNHPNICHLYDVGPDYLVMELIEGATLQGPVPLDEALRIAAQMASALEAAHEKNIVHRDLKPANIKLTPDGVVKVLDFGLARIDLPESGDPGDSPTLMGSPTIVGTILGTAAYMAPEQARGKVADKRADIWAFGVVLYEILTGERLFSGETISDVLAGVLKEQPDLTAVPPQVRRLLARCLQKDPKKRLRDIGNYAELLDLDTPAQASARAKAQPLRIAWGIAAVLAFAFIALGFLHFRESAPAQRVVRLSVPLPENSNVGFLDLSPDGRRLVLNLIREGTNLLYVRSLDSGELHALPGTNAARTPFWSPDGRFIGFFADNQLKVIPAAGGPVRVLCENTGLGGGGAWNRDGVILFGDGLRRVESRGGPCTSMGKEDPGSSRGFPMFLPDGKHYFYVRRATGELSGVYLATLDEPVGHKVLDDISSVVYTPPAAAGQRAHLLFLREGSLMAELFDESSLKTLGDPFPVSTQASTSSTSPQVAASASADATLVYLAGSSGDSQLTWVDRTGRQLGKAGPIANHSGVTLSPDGNFVAVAHRYQDGNEEWLYDLARNGSESRLMPRGPAGTPVWSPDSALIWFFMTGSEGKGLYQKDVRGGQQALLWKLADADPPRIVSDRSRDGRFLIYTEDNPKTSADIWYVPIEAGKRSGQPVKLLGTPALESQGQLSPDGKWLAYYSDESGKGEVYIRPFPVGSGTWKVSVEGGREPRWSPDGKELYFIAGSAGALRLMAAALEPDGRGGLRTGVPQKLFDFRSGGVVRQGNQWIYAVHPDGKRFLVNTMTATEAPTVNVILNWQKSIPAAQAKP